MSHRIEARRAGRPGRAELKKAEGQNSIHGGGFLQVRNGADERIGILIAGPHGWLAFGRGFASLVMRGGLHKNWRAAVAALGCRHE